MKYQQGFSLLELTIVLIIASLFMASTLNVIQQKNHINKYALTKKKLERIHKHIGLYFWRHGHLPCPASIDILPNNENYLEAINCEDDSFSLKNKYRSMIVDNDESPIFFGKLPAKNLSLKEDVIIDSWQNPIYYVVGKNLTNIDDYNPDEGKIKIIDQHQNSIFSSNNNAQYLLISFGSNGKKINLPCSVDNFQKLENENCDMDNTFVDSIYSDGVLKYDDIISFKRYISLDNLNLTTVCDTEIFLENFFEEDEDFKKFLYKANIPSYIPIHDTIKICNKEILLEKNTRNKCLVYRCGLDGKSKQSEHIIH